MAAAGLLPGAPTRYSTSFEFSNATNSRKSLLSGIRMAEVTKFDYYANELFRRQTRVKGCICGVGIGMVFKYSNYLLHKIIVLLG